MDTESSATLDKVEKSFTVPELPDGNCEKEEDWCSYDIPN